MADGSVISHPMRRLLSNRRGLLAGATALIGAGLTKLASPERAAAVTTMTTDANNLSSIDTGITNGGSGAALYVAGINFPTMAVFASRISNSTTKGRFGVLGTIGVLTNSPFPPQTDVVQAGVWGVNRGSDDAPGVKGETLGNGAGVRALGGGTAIGLWADATSRVGIFGTSTASTGIFGVSSASNPNGAAAPTTHAGVSGRGFGRIGVQGISDTSNGVQGTSTSGIGVYGESTNSFGCGGATSTPGYAGLFGYATVASAAGFLGVNAAPGGTAGYFHGNVTVDGGFQVVNGPKNALVAHPDGSYRRMYCQESPDPWFEDFGQGTLLNGQAGVTLDPDFDAVVAGDTYLVFLTEIGDLGGLYVSRLAPHRFEVKSRANPAASGSFHYRVVARRKDDVGRRMEKVELPKFDLHPPGPPATPPGQDKQPPR